MKHETRFVAVVMSAFFLLGGLGTSGAFAKESRAKSSKNPSYTGSISLKDQQSSGDETSEAADLQKYAVISADDAANTALAANPKTSVVRTALENENGFLVYSVVLNNGVDVKVDAGNGQVLNQENGKRDDRGHGGHNERSAEKEHDEKNEHNDTNDRDHEDVQVEQ